MSAGSPEPTGRLPKPVRDLNESAKPGETRSVVLAGGCFWCMEAVFEQLKGVTSVVSGFAGGTAATAHYETVSAGMTTHAESMQVTYDPVKISYGTLLQVFFSTHHPTQREGQGPDHGHQYRSAIFYANDRQKEVAQAYLRQLEQAKLFSEPIATTLEPLDHFYPAEDYHQDYVRHHPDHPYVHAWALPKLDKLRHLYPELLKTTAK
jgi:peptide-methionine (S)-S-oxide reductase